MVDSGILVSLARDMIFPSHSVLWKTVGSSSSIRVAWFRSWWFSDRRQERPGVRRLDFNSESGNDDGIISFLAKQRVRQNKFFRPEMVRSRIG
jgi:hypothetical protein